MTLSQTCTSLIIASLGFYFQNYWNFSFLVGCILAVTPGSIYLTFILLPGLLYEGMKFLLFLSIFVIPYMLLVILYVGGFLSIFVKYFIFNPDMYTLLGQIWIIPIVWNIITKSRIYFNFIEMLTTSLLLGFYGTKCFKPEYYYPGYDFTTAGKLFCINCIYILIFNIQYLWGSWFFMPKCFRRRLYEGYTRSLRGLDLNNNIPDCDICLNSLNQPELEYSDADPNYKWQRFEQDEYIQVVCSHKFHPNCLFKFIKNNPNPACPLGKASVPRDCYDD